MFAEERTNTTMSFSTPLELVKSGTTNAGTYRLCAELLAQCAAYTCSNDSDKLYSILGMLDLCFQADISEHIPVDYSKSASNLYTDVTTMLLRGSEQLGIMAYKS